MFSTFIAPDMSAKIISYKMKILKLLLISLVSHLIFLATSASAQSESTRFKIEADVIGGLSGESDSTRFANFGVNEPISGLSLKYLPDIKNFAGFVGGIVALDQDMDGLPDHQEIALGTDKTKADTDGDGLTDKEEVDSGTNPLLADTDGDGYSDMAEINANTNPLDSLSNPNQLPVFGNEDSFLIMENKPVETEITTLSASDPDGDSIVFTLVSGEGDQENGDFSLGTNGILKTKIILDYEAKTIHQIRVRVTDTKSGYVEKKFSISITNDIWDDSGVIGQLDDDRDGLINSQEAALNTDKNNPDTDGDGWNDGDEYFANSDPLKKDTDEDGLNDYEEFLNGTDPRKSDTDSDGFSDRAEIEQGTLPEDRYSYPGASDLRKNPNGDPNSPDGKIYLIHDPIDGKTWAQANKLALKFGGSLPQVVQGNGKLISHLRKLMEQEGVSTESDSLGLVGAWVGSSDGSTAMIDINGNLYLGDVEETDRLAFIVAHEKPAFRVPAILTMEPVISSNSAVARAEILDDGGDPQSRIGFWISEEILINNKEEKNRFISATMHPDGKYFEAKIDRLDPGKTYYLRAFAENSAGVQYGSVRRVKIEKNYAIPFEGKTTGVENWYTSDWFGTFQRANENWIFHANFGWWLYASNEAGFGQWFWTDEFGWCWTSKSIYPFLWRHNAGNWFYWMAKKDGRNLFWNYATSKSELF